MREEIEIFLANTTKGYEARKKLFEIISDELCSVFYENKKADFDVDTVFEEWLNQVGFLGEDLNSLKILFFIIQNPNRFLGYHISASKGLLHDEKWMSNQRVNSFNYEDKQEHFVASRFDAFFDDMKEEVILQIPYMLENSSLLEPIFSSNIEIAEEKNWQKGVVLTYPEDNLDEGIGIILGLLDENMHYISMFPHLNFGKKYKFELSEVFVWENQFEAQIEVDLGFTNLCFYDIHYVYNRKEYFKGNKYLFQILGIAYGAKYREDEEIQVQMKPEVLKAMGKSIEDSLQTFSLKGMASFVRIDKWDRDDYFFSGMIESVKEIENTISNEKAWICTTRVLRDSLDDECIYDMDILITKRTWSEKNPPKQGDDIEGTVWMQGKLSSDDRMCEGRK